MTASDVCFDFFYFNYDSAKKYNYFASRREKKKGLMNWIPGVS